MAKIAIIRISGKVDVVPDIKKTFEMLMLDKKFSCAVIDDKPEIIGMVKKVQDFVAFGDIKDDVLKELMEKRGKKDKKMVFHLHPPRGGFKKSTFLHYPRGILGKNEKINELILKML